MQLDQLLEPPKTTSEFLGHAKFISDFNESLKNNENSHCLIICIGNSGIGKSSLVKLMLNQMNFDITEMVKFTYKEKNSKKEIDKGERRNYKYEISNFLANKTISNFFSSRKKILLIDDLDIYLQNDKEIQSFLTSIATEELNPLHVPIVCILNKLSSRKLSKEIKKVGKIIYFGGPTLNASEGYIFDIVRKYYSASALTSVVIKNIQDGVKVYKNNLKLILINLDQILKGTYVTEDMGINAGDNFCQMSPFEITQCIYQTPMTLSEIQTISYSDSNLITMLIHENSCQKLISYVEQFHFNIQKEYNKIKGSCYKTDKQIKDDIRIDIIINYKKILNDFCMGDILENIIQKKQAWTLMNNMLLIRLFRTNNIISKYYYNFKQEGIPVKNSESLKFSQLLALSGSKGKYQQRKQILFERERLSPVDHIFDSWINMIIRLIGKITFHDNNERGEGAKDRFAKKNIKVIKCCKFLSKRYHIDNETMDAIGRYNRDYQLIPEKNFEKFSKMCK
jgi:hypothetical protein